MQHEADFKRNSNIYLNGGNASGQRDFIAEYELAASIKESNAPVIMGLCGGAYNMMAHWIEAKCTGDAELKVFDGLGLDDFATIGNRAIDEDGSINAEILPISHSMEIYVRRSESTIRTKGGKIEIFGDVYLISNSKICKIGN